MSDPPKLNRVEIGDCRSILPTLPEKTFQCCVTSPPYWGLRDYGHPDQIGRETTPEAYVASMVGVFREVRRVLRDDGTCWVNLGDSYAHPPSGRSNGQNMRRSTLSGGKTTGERAHSDTSTVSRLCDGLKPKDLVGIPWRVAFALQADGWYLRSDIIWSKPNPMPESVTDRPTKAHEYVFLLAKSERYFYDAAAIAVPAKYAGEQLGICRGSKRRAGSMGVPASGNEKPGADASIPTSANARSVWEIVSEPYSGAHFATMPTAIAARCIQAGSSLGSAVLDPFMGSGTVGQVAESLGRRWFGCELNADYGKLSADRTRQTGLAFAKECS